MALATLWAFSGPALAADDPPDPDLSIEDTRRAGPFHIRPFVLVKDVGYDDNVLYTSQNRQGDTTATAGAGLRSVLLWGDRGGLNLFQQFDYVAFGKNTELNHWNGDLRGRGVFLLKHAALSLEDHYTSRQERPNNEIDRRLRRKNNAITAAARTTSEGRLNLEATLRHQGIDYSSDVPGFENQIRRLDRDETSLTLAGEVRILPKTTLTLEGTTEDVDFVDQTEGRDSDSYSILPGLKFDASASIQGHFKLGVKSLEAPDRPQDDTDTTVGEAALSFRMGGSARLKGTFRRDLVFSTLQENLYYDSTGWTAAYEQFLSRRLRGELRYGQETNDYPNEITRGGINPFQGFREDRITTYGITFRYRINDQVDVVVAGSRVERESTDDFQDVTRNLYAVGSTYNF
jgi:hypothetical protein